MKWIKIFKAGTHKDSLGREHTYTEQDLDRMVELYNEQPEADRRQAPLVLGHPKDNAPAYGWVAKVKRDGKHLLAACEQLAEDFVESVNDGRYKFRSASFYPTGLLRHVGFLGATQPAVAGLGEASFSSDDDAIIFDFMEWDTSYRFERIVSLFQRLREWIIESADIDTANKIMSPWEIDTIQPPAPEAPDFNEPHPTIKDNEMELKEQLETLTRDFAQTKAERDELKAKSDAQAQQIGALSAEVAKLHATNTRREFENYCDGLVKEGKLLAAERDFFVEDLVSKASASADFAEGTSPVDKTKAMLEARKPHSLFTEVATNRTASTPAGRDFSERFNVDEDGAALDERVHQIMKDRNISDYSEALDIAVKEL